MSRGGNSCPIAARRLRTAGSAIASIATAVPTMLMIQRFFSSIGTKRTEARCCIGHAYTHTKKSQLRSLRPPDIIGAVRTTSQIRKHAAAGLRLPLRRFDERHRCRDDAATGARDEDYDRDPGRLNACANLG
jgi:hypothetical protein